MPADGRFVSFDGTVIAYRDYGGDGDGLVLLHGIGGDENEWTRGGSPNVILDNLYADKKAVPMIVVLPNGRASKDLTARSPFGQQGPRDGGVHQAADLLAVGVVRA